MTGEAAAGEFSGKVVLITGAASGLGRAAALAFAREGATLYLVDLDAQGLAETAATIGDGADCVTFSGDLGSAAVCAQAVGTAIEAFGQLDILCNVAGMLRIHGLAGITEQDWSRLVASNLTGPLFMMQAAMPHLIAARGNVVNVASSAAFVGQAYTSAYAATKGGLVALTRSLAMEFMHAPVRINALAPGAIATPMAQGVTFPDGADMSLVLRHGGIRPPSSPEDIVEPLLFLASDKARSVHGATWLVDKGITAG